MKEYAEGLCDIHELQLITNLLYDKNKLIEWFYPPIGKIASFATNKNLKAKIISRSDYGAKRESFLSRNPAWAREIPNYDEFLVPFFCAGLLPMAKIKTKLMSLARKKNIFHGGKPLWLGYDTNVLRRSFFSNIINFIKFDDELKKQKLENSVGHVIADGVTEEIMQGMDYKYKSRKVEELAIGFPEASNFLNQPDLLARLLRIGMAEIKHMKNYVYSATPSAKGDIEIIKGYEEFENYRNAEVTLFTSDKNFVEMAHQKALMAYYVEYNVKELLKHIERNPITLDAVSRIIYYGTMVFGMTKLNGFKLYSIWRGKNVEDWDRRHIKVKVEGTLSKPFRKAHGVLKDMKKSGFITKN